MPKRIPVSAAKALAKEQGCSQVIVAAWDGERTHIVTYGDTVEACDQAALGGDRIKKALGWPESLNAVPNRVKTLQAENARLKAVTWPDDDAVAKVISDLGLYITAGFLGGRNASVIAKALRRAFSPAERADG